VLQGLVVATLEADGRDRMAGETAAADRTRVMLDAGWPEWKLAKERYGASV
jgi:hypothetical protein